MKKVFCMLILALALVLPAQAVRYGIKKQIFVSGAQTAMPSYLCYSQNTNQMYSGNFGTNEVVAIDCAGDLLMGAVPSVYPGAMVYDQINNRVYLHDDGIDFFAINCADNKLDTTLGYGQGGGPVDYNPLNNKIYHLDQTFSQIFAFNGTDYSVNTFSGYYNMLYYQPKNVLYTGQEYTDTMLAIDGSTNVTIAKIGVSGLTSSEFFMAADTIGGRVYVAMPNWDIISVIDPSANLEDVRLGLPDKPADMAFCPINRKMFVACNGKSAYSLAVIDTLNKVDSIQVGDSVSTVVYNPNDSLIYIGCNSSGYVKLIDPRLPTPKVVDSVYTTFNPQFRDMSVDKGGDVYCALYNSDNIYVIGQIPLRMWQSTMTNGYWFDYMAWQYSDDGGNSWGNFSTIYPNNPDDSTITIQTGHTIQQTLGSPAVLVDQLIVDGALELVENSLTIADGPGDDIIVNGIYRYSGGTFTKNPGATMIFRQYSAYEHNIDGDAIPTAIWDTLSTLEITGVMNTMPAGMNQAFGNITWNCFQQAVDVILPGGSAFSARDIYVSSTGPNTVCLTSVAKPVLTVNNLNIGNGTTLLGSGGVRKLHVKGNMTVYDPGWLYLTDTLNRGIDTLFLYGNYAHVMSGIGGGGPDSTAIVFCGSDTQVYYDENEMLTGHINFQVNPGAFLKIGGWSTLGYGSQGNFTLMPGATLSYSDMWGIYPTGQDTGVIRVLGARNYSQGANYHIYSMSTGPYRTGPGIPDTVNQLIIESYGDQVYLSKDVAVMDTLKLLANNLQINGHRLSLFGPIYQTSGNLWGDSLASLVIMGGNPAPVILPSWVRDLGLLNINRPATITMTDTMLIYNRLELVNGILNNGGNKLSFLDGVSIFRNGSGGLAGAGLMVFVNQVNLEYGAGIITAGAEIPLNALGLRSLALKGLNDTLIVNRDTLNIWNNLSLSGGIRFNGKMFSSYGLIDTMGPAGELIFTDSCSASFLGSAGTLYLPGITGGRLTIDNSTGGSVMRRKITCTGPLNLSLGNMVVGANTLTIGDSLTGSGLLVTDSTSSLVFQGNAVTQVMPSTVNNLSRLSWNRSSFLTITSPLALHDTLRLGQGIVDNSVNLTLRSGVTTIRNSGILMMPPVREGPNDVVYQTHGGGRLTAGNELAGNATELNNLTLSIGLLSNDTIALAGSVQINGRLSLQQGVLSVGANTLTLRDSLDVLMGQLAADSTSTLQILNSPFLFAIPSSVKELDSLILNSPSGLKLPDTVHIRSAYRQTSGKISFGQLIYGPAATLEYNKFGSDTSSNFEFPDIGGPHNLIAAATGGLQLHTNRTVPGTLTLNNTLYTGANTVYVDTLGNVVQGAGFVDGNLAKLIPWTADTIVTYELGSAGTGPSPVDIEVFNNTVPTFVTAGIKGAGHPLVNDSTACLRKFWSLSGAGLAADACLITLHYLPADFNPPNFTETAHESTMIAGRYDNGATPGWQFPGIVSRNILGTTDGGSIVLSQSGNFAENPEFTLGRDSMAIFNLMVDTTNPAVTLVSPASGATGVLLQQQVVVSFSETIDTASFRFRCTPDPLYWNLSWSSGDSQVTLWHGDFAPSTLYNFRVDSAADKSGNPILNPPYQWSFTTVPPDSMSFNLAGGAYRMFSVPLSPVDSTPAQILGDELGVYSDSTWRIFGYKPSSGYLERPNLSSGQGYWLATAGNAQVEVKGTRWMNFYNQPIDSGWNLIGDPFDTTVTLANIIVLWSDTSSHFVNFTDSTVNSVVRQRMYNWRDESPDFENNGVWDSLTPYIAGDQMHPWTGYALYAVRPCTLMMERFMGKGQVEPAKAPQYQIGWQLAMDVASGNAVDRGLKLGVSPQAKETYDRLDAEKPPLISNNVKAFIPHQDWNQGPCQDYQHDFRPAADYIEWPLMIETAQAGQTVVLNSQITGELGKEGYLYLLDRRKGKTFDLKTQKAIGFSGSQELAVVYSSSPFDGRNLTPLIFGLGRMGPNPFVQRTTINYQIPKSGMVNLQIYNITGQRVRTLVSQNLPPGYYSQVWDGRNDGGRSLSAGVYIVRLSALGRSAAQKIVKLQ